MLDKSCIVQLKTEQVCPKMATVQILLKAKKSHACRHKGLLAMSGQVLGTLHTQDAVQYKTADCWEGDAINQPEA